MLPIVSSSPSETIRDFIKSDTLYTLEVEGIISVRSLAITNRLRYPGPPFKTLNFLLVHGYHYSGKIDFIGKDVCVWKRKEAFAEPTVSAAQAQSQFLTDTLPVWVNEVIVYEEDNIVAMTVPRLFPGGFGGSSSSISLVIEKLLMQGFVNGKKVDTPLGHYWVYTRTIAYIPAVTAHAMALEFVPAAMAGSESPPSPSPPPNTATATATAAHPTNPQSPSPPQSSANISPPVLPQQ